MFERLFSFVGDILTKKTNSLLPENLDKLWFCREVCLDQVQVLRTSSLWLMPWIEIWYLFKALTLNLLVKNCFRKYHVWPCICASIFTQKIFVLMVPKVTFGGSFGFGCLNLRWRLRSSVNSTFGRSLEKTISSESPPSPNWRHPRIQKYSPPLPHPTWGQRREKKI